MSFKVIGDTAYRTKEGTIKAPDPLGYEQKIYSKGLRYEKSSFTFQSLEWEEQASKRMSAE